MTRRRVAVLVVLLLVTAGGLAAVVAGETGDGPDADSDAPPGATEGRETFTASVGTIRLAPDGEICARQLESDVYRVTIRNATLRNTTVYHEDEVGQRIHTARTEVNDTLVTYTNGENPKVRALARTDACVVVDQPTRTTVEAYYVVSGPLLSDNVTVVSEANDSEPPEPGGLTLGDAAPDPTENVTDRDEPGNRSTPTPEPELTRTPAPRPSRTPTPPADPTPGRSPAPDPTLTPTADPVPTLTPNPVPDPTPTPETDPIPVPGLGGEAGPGLALFRTAPVARNATRGDGSAG